MADNEQATMPGRALADKKMVDVDRMPWIKVSCNWIGRNRNAQKFGRGNAPRPVPRLAEGTAMCLLPEKQRNPSAAARLPRNRLA
jgi:hypothetical protein